MCLFVYGDFNAVFVRKLTIQGCFIFSYKKIVVNLNLLVSINRITVYD